MGRFLLFKKILRPVQSCLRPASANLSGSNCPTLLKSKLKKELTVMTILKRDDFLPERFLIGWFRSWFPYLRWVPTSPKLLRDAEEKILSYVSTKSDGWYVNSSFAKDEVISCTSDDPDAPVTTAIPALKDCKIWTRRFRSSNMLKDIETPLVMIHGMGAGLGFFCLNFDTLAKHRTVYAIDLPGFGRSSRCYFSSDPDQAEDQYVAAIEKWRQNAGIKKMVLLGHSFGGYLSAAYALKHPANVQHLILADPWGLPERPADIAQRYNVPVYVRAIFQVVRHFNPLATLRAIGPFGPSLIKRLRPDLINKFDALFPEDLTDEEKFSKLSEIIPAYLFHCNAHYPSGESAFHSMMTGFAWAKRPMFPRLADLSEDIPMTVLYGEQSWVSTISRQQFEEVRKNTGHTEVHIIPNASHHVYAQCDDFNEAVRKAASFKM